ncbi:MAG: helix-hairpin-helix domain-containing protein [Bacteroidales bacterium]|nr:helix-hairpin-helix domain-containing protein [Bacteroidales bacterium]
MEKERKKGKTHSGLSGSFTVGAIALVFLIIGYQVALFIHRAASLKLAADRDRPDTVYVVDAALARRILEESEAEEVKDDSPVVIRRESAREASVASARDRIVPRKAESFRFNPNTVSVTDLQRLGFSEKQAKAIDNYRKKGGRFRKPEDFARSFVVADSVFSRLEPFIDIPRTDINRADSASLVELPGIGPWFASRIVSYREALGGFSRPEQLMEIRNFDREKYDGLKDLISCSRPEPYPLWSLPEEELSKHPYISKSEAHGIVLYRKHHPAGECTVEGLRKAGVLSEEHAGKLSGCRIQSSVN